MHLPPMLRLHPMPAMEIAGKEHGHMALPCQPLMAFIGSTAIGLQLPSTLTPHAAEHPLLAYATDHPPNLPWEPCQGAPESPVAKLTASLRKLGHDPAALPHGHPFAKAMYASMRKHGILQPVAANESRTMVFSVKQQHSPRNVLYRLSMLEIEAIVVWVPGREGLTLGPPDDNSFADCVHDASGAFDSMRTCGTKCKSTRRDNFCSLLRRGAYASDVFCWRLRYPRRMLGLACGPAGPSLAMS